MFAEQHARCVEATEREGAAWALERASALGELIGGRMGRSSCGAGRRTRTGPCCAPTTATGNRIDEVEYHPAWHQLMALGVEHELHALPWREPTGPRPMWRAPPCT